MRLHVAMASHNRRDITLESIGSLKHAARMADLGVSITLYDDASTDQTPEAVQLNFPDVTIIRGTGSSFWAHGMYQAERHILSEARDSDFNRDEYVVWYNDDVRLDSTAFIRLASHLTKHRGSIFVCAMRDPLTGKTTYSGFDRTGPHPLRLSLVEPGPWIRSVDTFNGNFVVVPMEVALRLGSIDGEYAHALADIDYGYRAGAAGVPVLLAPGTYGSCSRNPVRKSAGIRRDWKDFVGVKGSGHPDSLRRILRLGAPRTYIFYFGATYALWWVRAFRRIIFRG